MKNHYKENIIFEENYTEIKIMKKNYSILNFLGYGAIVIVIIFMAVMKCSCATPSQTKTKRILEEQHKKMVTLDSSTNRTSK